jgi:hypothetical protein
MQCSCAGNFADIGEYCCEGGSVTPDGCSGGDCSVLDSDECSAAGLPCAWDSGSSVCRDCTVCEETLNSGVSFVWSRGDKNDNNQLICNISLVFFVFILFSAGLARASSISLSLSSYDSEIYKYGTVNIPIVVTASNISGNAEITLTPRTGLHCDTCTQSYTFSGGTNEQGTVTFTLTGTQTGTYNPPFISISASSGLLLPHL